MKRATRKAASKPTVTRKGKGESSANRKPSAKGKPSKSARKPTAAAAPKQHRWFAVVIDIPQSQWLVAVEEFEDDAKSHASDLREVAINYGGEYLTIPCRASVRPADVVVEGGAVGGVAER